MLDLDPAAPLPEGATLLDVREQDEWDEGHAADAVHIPLAEVAYEGSVSQPGGSWTPTETSMVFSSPSSASRGLPFTEATTADRITGVK
ncbi:hypothetical protein GCM10009809_23160 [Isoptericola hypogeus]|uniref:Rhodanese domain-containing protein n=1 Tax=Isoptericola hypogeus TaxID=300179 RepID=A0ABP4VN94_9MICO